jgi:hypothetical protein
MDKSYQASWGSRLCLLLFVVPAIALFLFTGFEVGHQDNLLVGLIIVATGLLLALWLVFMLTMRVKMNETSIARTWLLGSKVVPIKAITTLRWGGSRGQTILSIVYSTKKRFIMLSSIVVPREKLLGIQSDILALRGLEGEALWPPMAPYVDIEKMVEHKHG